MAEGHLLHIRQDSTCEQDFCPLAIQKKQPHELAGENKEVVLAWDTSWKWLNDARQQAILDILTNLLVQVVEDVSIELHARHINRIDHFLIASPVFFWLFARIVLKDKFLEVILEDAGLQDFPRVRHKVLIDRDLIWIHANDCVGQESQEGAYQILAFSHGVCLMDEGVIVLERKPL